MWRTREEIRELEKLLNGIRIESIDNRQLRKCEEVFGRFKKNVSPEHPLHPFVTQAKEDIKNLRNGRIGKEEFVDTIKVIKMGIKEVL